jgi:hypothetical protein
VRFDDPDASVATRYELALTLDVRHPDYRDSTLASFIPPHMGGTMAFAPDGPRQGHYELMLEGHPREIFMDSMVSAGMIPFPLQEGDTVRFGFRWMSGAQADSAGVRCDGSGMPGGMPRHPGPGAACRQDMTYQLDMVGIVRSDATIGGTVRVGGGSEVLGTGTFTATPRPAR